MNENAYVPALDGLRFLAFLLVLLHHFAPAPGFGGLVVFVQTWGWVGVDLFFVLSSFLITRLLMREYNQRNQISLKNFWVRRMLRIWPLYYLIIFLALYVLPYLHTLNVEEHFYLLWPLIFVFIKRNELINYFTKTAIALIAIVVIMRYYIISEGSLPGDILMNSIFRCDSFLIGAIFAVNERRLLKIKQGYYLMTSLALLAMVTSSPSIHESSLSLSWQLTLIAVAFACLILASLQGGRMTNFLQRPSLVFLGKISYGLYMFHKFSFLAFSNPDFNRHLSWLDSFLLSLAITVVLASVSYFAFERFFLNFKKNFS